MPDGKQSKKAAEKAARRSRNWEIIGYPDSLPENWLEILEDTQVPVLVSPLHDQDVNPDGQNGEKKKPHYHILFKFGSVKSFEQIKEISDSLHAPNPMKMDDYKGAARYLCHLDNPSKAQYNTENVKQINGADYLAVCQLSTDKYSLVAEMMDFVDEFSVYSLAELLAYSREHNESWFRALCDNCGWIMREYMESRVWERKNAIFMENMKYERATKQLQKYIDENPPEF